MKLNYFGLIIMISSFSVNVFGQDEMANTNLYDLSLEELMKIEVSTPSKQEELLMNASAIITVITADEIEIFGSNNLNEVLERVVSIYVSGTYSLPQNTIGIRGDVRDHYDNHILKLINGRPIRNSNNEGLNTPFYLSIPLSAVERIEIVRGAGSVLYGTGAYTGIINIVTRKTDEDSIFEVSTGAGSFNSRSGEFFGRYNTKGFNIGMTGKFFTEDGWNLEMKDEKGINGSMRMSEDNIGGLLTAGYGDLKLTSYYLKSTQRAFVMRPDWSAPETYIIAEKAFADLEYRFDFHANWNLLMNATYNYSMARRGVETGESNDLIGEVLSTYKWERGKLRIGGEVNYLTGKADVIPAYTKFWGRAYIDAEHQILSILKITGGGQLNAINDKAIYFTPRLGIVSNFNDNFGIKALYSEGFRSPTALETDIDLPQLTGNQDLKPETVKSADVQFYYINKFLNADVVWYCSQQSRLIQREQDSISGVFSYMNNGQGMFTGLEFNSKLIISNAFHFSGNAAYQINKNENGTDNFTTLPNLMVKIGAGFQNKSLSFAVHSNFIGPATDVIVKNPNRKLVNPPADEFVYLSANLNLDVVKILHLKSLKKLRLNIYSTNLLDQKIYQPEFVRSVINTMPMKSGRAVYARIILGF